MLNFDYFLPPLAGACGFLGAAFGACFFCPTSIPPSSSNLRKRGMTGLAQFTGTTLCPKQHREFRSPQFHFSKIPPLCRRPKMAKFCLVGSQRKSSNPLSSPHFLWRKKTSEYERRACFFSSYIVIL